MKIVAVSDLHLDHVSSGVHRFDEIEAAVRLAVEAAIERQADAFFFLGDAMDPDSGSCVFRCLDVLVRSAVRLNGMGIPFVAISGNHDVVEAGRLETTLSPLRSLPGVHLFEQPGSIVIHDVHIVSLPYTSTSQSYDPAQAVERLCGGDGQLVVIEHMNVRGAIPGSEESDMPRGRSVWLPDEELAVVSRRRPTLVLGGHIHHRQLHKTPSGLEVQIIGNVARLSHSEEANEPAFLVVDV